MPLKKHDLGIVYCDYFSKFQGLAETRLRLNSFKKPYLLELLDKIK